MMMSVRRVRFICWIGDNTEVNMNKKRLFVFVLFCFLSPLHLKAEWKTVTGKGVVDNATYKIKEETVLRNFEKYVRRHFCVVRANSK